MKLFRTAATMSVAMCLAGTAIAQNGRPAAKIAPEDTLRRPLVFTTYDWKNPSQPVIGPRVETHLCLLTRVSGKFNGAGERVAVFIDSAAAGGARWMINGTSGQAELRGTMTCVARDQFVNGDGLFDGLVAKVYTNHTNGNCAQHVVPMGAPDKNNAFFLSGIAGKFAGGGESVSVISQGGQGTIRVTGCSGYVDGTLMSVGHLSGKPVFYRTQSARLPAGSPGVDFVLDDAGPESHLFSGADLKVGGPEMALVPVNEAFCGLTEVRGKLQGYGEEVGVFPGKQYWGLYVAENGEDAALHGTARCIARDQRPK